MSCLTESSKSAVSCPLPGDVSGAIFQPHFSWDVLLFLLPLAQGGNASVADLPAFSANFSIKTCRHLSPTDSDFSTIMVPACSFGSLPAHAIPNQQTVQCMHQYGPLGWPLQQVRFAPTVPLLRRRQPIQVLVGARMVVKQREIFQR